MRYVLAVALALSFAIIPMPVQAAVELVAATPYIEPVIDTKSAKVTDFKYSLTSKITLGDELAKAGTFKPDITVSKWNGQGLFKLALDTKDMGELNTPYASASDSITSSSAGWDIEFKTVPVKDGWNDEGGIDITFTAWSAPPSNTLRFVYDSANVDAFLQPPLTADEIKEGVGRPEHAINSVAFYSKTLANNQYKTGKIGHLYRMKAVDAKGGETWTDWNVDGGYIYLIIPQKWLDTAVYPVRIEPVGDTFGYTGAGGSATVYNANQIIGQVGTPASSGTVDYISVSMKGVAGASFKSVLVEKTGETIVANGVGDATGDTNTSKHWGTFAYTTKPSVTGSTTYYGCLIGDTNGFTIYRDSGTGRFYDSSNSYSTPTDPTDGAESATVICSIYVTYTPSGGGGYANEVDGVAAASFAEVDGVIKANIVEVGR